MSQPMDSDGPPGAAFPAGASLARLDLPAHYPQEKFAQYDGRGIRTFFVEDVQPYMLGWNGADLYSYDYYEAHLARLVEMDADARFIVRFGAPTGAPYLWCQLHPDELVMLPTGVRLYAPSLASDLWLRESSDAVRRFVMHFEDSRFADRIAGYEPIFGGEQWDGFGECPNQVASHETGKVQGDLSEPMLRGFRGWVRRRYGDDVERLRDAWARIYLTFDTVRLPTHHQRTVGGAPGQFRPLDHFGAFLPDYFLYYSECNARIAVEWCRAIKESLRRPKPVGLTFGRVYGWANTLPYPQGSGQAELQTVLQSSYIDFLHSPPDPYNAGWGGVHATQLPQESVSLHGKAVVDDIQPPTHLRTGGDESPQDEWESVQMLKRDFAHAIARGLVPCLAERDEPPRLKQTYRRLAFDDPALGDAIARLVALAGEEAGRGNQSAAQVALFSSPQSSYYRKLDPLYGNLFVEALRQFVLPRLGLPFDDYLLEDFERVERDYRVCIFPDAVCVPPRLAESIRRHVEQGGATAVWFYAPGLVADGWPEVFNCEPLTGMRLDFAHEEALLDVRLEAVDHPYLEGLMAGDVFGAGVDLAELPAGGNWPVRSAAGHRISPVFSAQDAGALVLGRLTCNGQPGLAVKSVGRGRSVYLAAPLPPPALLRNICGQAGARVYSPQGDLIYANSGFVAVRAAEGGLRTVRLPAASDVADAWTGEPVAKAASKIELDMKQGQVALLRLKGAN